MSKVKLLICYHKPATLFQDDIMTPIHVGRANAKAKSTKVDKNLKWMLDHMIGDDTGENISNKNGYYNELTSLYWAWKNYDELGNPDYIGLMHYRRHFVFKEDQTIVYNIENFNMDTYYKEINYSPKKLEKLVDGCDFLTHIGKVGNVYNHYIENHRKEDLDLAVDIMGKKYPEYIQVAQEYFAGDYSNFCNMFIMNKKIFFEYCEWLFDILKTFEETVDLTDKRFFISERLTGIFIAKLMKDESLKYKVLPISYIDEPVNVTMAMPVDNSSVFQAACTITSMLESAKGHHKYKIYLLTQSDFSEYNRKILEQIQSKYEFATIITLNVPRAIKQEQYLLYLSELLQKENKCIYLSGNILGMQDLGEFYQTCSVDDYYAVGVAKGEYDASHVEKVVSDALVVINCAKLRKYHLWDTAKKQLEQGKDSMDIFNAFCSQQLGYVPWYFITRETDMDGDHRVLGHQESRGHLQMLATWRVWLLFNNLNPWENSQGVYSIFWWNSAIKVPSGVKLPNINANVVKTLYTQQQIEVNNWGNWWNNQQPKEVPQVVEEVVQEKVVQEEVVPEVMPEVVQEVEPVVSQVTPREEYPNNLNQEDWRSYGIGGKLKFYYQHNGMKKTVSYGMKKILGSGKQ